MKFDAPVVVDVRAADVGYFSTKLSYLAGVPVSVAPQVVPAKEVAVETKAALPRSQQSSLSAAEILIADFGGDLMAMFDGPPAEALAA